MSQSTQNCEFCNSPAHIWFNCPKKPDGWKPERLKKSTGKLVHKLGAATGDESRGLISSTRVVRGSQATIAEPVAVDHRSREATIAAPFKSTAAGIDRLGTEGMAGVSPAPDRTLTELEVAPLDGDQVEPGAGAAAPPVDALVEAAVAQAKRRGRPISPNPKSPRAKYQRNLMRKKRALKAQQEGKSE